MKAVWISLMSGLHSILKDNIENSIYSKNEVSENIYDEDTTNNSKSYENNNADNPEEKEMKKVRFNLNPQVNWINDDAQEEDRRGPWEQMALDRYRFMCRISKQAEILDKILNVTHRAEIYKLRFK